MLKTNSFLNASKRHSGTKSGKNSACVNSNSRRNRRETLRQRKKMLFRTSEPSMLLKIKDRDS